MDNDSIFSLIDEIAASTLMTEPSDGALISALVAQFSRLETLLTSETAAEASELNHKAAACSSLLFAISEGISGDVQKDLNRIAELVGDMQRLLRAWDKNDEDQISTNIYEIDTMLSDADDNRPAGSRFMLPSYVDEGVYREFISNTKHVLDEIEREALLIEKGDAAAKNSLKRRIHTLKGESGVLSLNDVELVCHAIEDLFTAEYSPRQTADALLETVDWIQKALLSYADFRLPEPRGTAVATRLGNCLAPMEALPEDTPTTDAVLDVSERRNLSKSAHERFADDAPSGIVWDGETITLMGEFIDESEEGLNTADQILMNIDDSGVEPEKINALFRIFHTIKGVSGFLELSEITKLAHTTETMMDQIRSGFYPLSGAVLDLVFDSTEIMRDMLAKVRGAVEKNTTVRSEPRLAKQLEKLNRVIAGSVPGENILIDAGPNDKLGEILAKSPTRIPEGAIFAALERQHKSGRPIGEELVAGGAVKPKAVSQALRAQKRAAGIDAAGKIKETVKVDLERVDRLVEMIGELVIVESMVVHAKEITSLVSPKVRNYLSQLEKITRDLQDTGMRMRMVPVRGVFQKMARMVRDLGRKSGKSIRLVARGEGTEMDRSMVEQLTDPLVHMIRNAVDHAIETRDVRMQLGKPVEGTIGLLAYHEGGSIVIEITDDGKGLDREAILEKARKQGIVSEEDQLSDAEVFKLIFAPGFSTAEQVTEISGRGVGMDVVKRNIESMRGRIAIESEPGKGTVFKIILPLTLAIIDGMLVSCGPEQYIIPTLSIVESLQVTPGMLNSFADKGELINVRGEIFPLLRLGRLFDIEPLHKNASEGLVVVLEGVGKKVGLYVDDVLTQQQVVIKSLGSGIQQTPYISGGAIMSDGTVGLILNVEEITEIVDKRNGQRFDCPQELARQPELSAEQGAV